jgi:hypothetical protein
MLYYYYVEGGLCVGCIQRFDTPHTFGTHSLPLLLLHGCLVAGSVCLPVLTLTVGVAVACNVARALHLAELRQSNSAINKLNQNMCMHHCLVQPVQSRDDTNKK